MRKRFGGKLMVPERFRNLSVRIADEIKLTVKNMLSVFFKKSAQGEGSSEAIWPLFCISKYIRA